MTLAVRKLFPWDTIPLPPVIHVSQTKLMVGACRIIDRSPPKVMPLVNGVLDLLKGAHFGRVLAPNMRWRRDFRQDLHWNLNVFAARR